MVYTNYLRGRAKEYRIVKHFKALGYTAFRSAGSHSPIDVIAINFMTKQIKLIQSKSGYFTPGEKQKIFQETKDWAGHYRVDFELWAD